MQALPKLRRRKADTLADYLTRSVRRASGFVLAGDTEILAVGQAVEPSQLGLGILSVS